MIIATAGHVDHGKTALIKALTGTDTDRLPEEKARGLSIDLGFAYQTLSDTTTLGFVDVPGHERFIRNMLAGVVGIDLGLLVVAADDGVMPQTREHVAILKLLGIDQCVAAITKIDRVDDDRILEVHHQIETLLGNSGHEKAIIYPVCALDNEGIDVLKNELSERAKTVSGRSIGGHFRMTIDRVFTLKGTGLVVTGMVFSGETSADDQLVLSSDGAQVRVRGIRAYNQASNRAQAGERCALNIVGRGVGANTVKRGDWLMHSNLHAPTRRIDVDLRVLDSENKFLKHWTPTHLHIGADHLTARVAVLSGGAIAVGERGLAQLVLSKDAFVVHGDRFVLRDQSAQRTIAGGHIVAPFSPKRGRARPTRIAELQAMNRRHSADVLAALAEISEAGVSLTSFSVSHNLTKHEVDVICKSLSLKQVGGEKKEWAFSNKQWQGLLDRIEQVVRAFHLSKPTLPGFGLREIQLALKPYVETAVLNDACSNLVDRKRLGRCGARFHLISHVIEVSDFDRQLWAKAATSLAPNSGSPLSLNQAAEMLKTEKKVLEMSLKNAVKMGEMVLVAKNRYLPISYMIRLGYATEELAERTVSGLFTVADFCKETKTGRNFAIELLEYFDRLGFTARTGNNRRLKHSAAVIFSVNGEQNQGRGSHPGGAPGLQIQ